jgi:hypothetical protein
MPGLINPQIEYEEINVPALKSRAKGKNAAKYFDCAMLEAGCLHLRGYLAGWP